MKFNLELRGFVNRRLFVDLAIIALLATLLTACRSSQPYFSDDLTRAPLFPILPTPFAAPFQSDRTEAVILRRVFDAGSKALIQRSTGELYLIEYGVGAIALWRYKDKAIVIKSAGLFLGAGSSLVLPADREEARIGITRKCRRETGRLCWTANKHFSTFVG